MARQSSPPEIHQEKREIVEDVRARNLLIELDAVEQRRSPVQQHDIAQMEVAVALADETWPTPAFQRVRTAVELATGVVGHAIRSRRIQTRPPELGESISIPFDDPGHASLAAVIRAMLGRLVKIGNYLRQWGHELDAKGTDRGQPIEQGFLRESIHLHQPVNGPFVFPECIGSVIAASDGDDATIERWRRPPIEANFGLTQPAAALGGWEVEIVEPNGPLEFVRARTREKEDGCVRIDSLDRRAAVCGWRGKEVDNRWLVFGDHGRRPRMSMSAMDAPVRAHGAGSKASGRPLGAPGRSANWCDRRTRHLEQSKCRGARGRQRARHRNDGGPLAD
jgi:hypothetical protein